ncbi:uncharacterized protein LOC135834587 [Planococcus citri]|uniref:uncharacterized protein LOC135834587 n=1 Tax=Planococcus citri TaxID=170843 RepID=UPI0031F8A365
MDLPHVDTCCFGLLPLKTGSLICGIVSLIVESSFHGYSSLHTGNETIKLIYEILIVCGIIGAILLIVGILMNRSSLARLFIVAFALLIIFTIVMCIWVLLSNRGRFIDRSDYIINTVLYVCIIGYCVIVVNSYYKTMG